MAVWDEHHYMYILVAEILVAKQAEVAKRDFDILENYQHQKRQNSVRLQDSSVRLESRALRAEMHTKGDNITILLGGASL